MSKDDKKSNSGNWNLSAFVETSILRGFDHYDVPRAVNEDNSRISPVISVSVEEKVSDVVRSYPHLKAFVKSRTKGPDSRIRDLEISTKERNQLLCQIIAARRQEMLTSTRTGQTQPFVCGSRLRPECCGPLRKRLTQ